MKIIIIAGSIIELLEEKQIRYISVSSQNYDDAVKTASIFLTYGNTVAIEWGEDQK